MQVFLIRHAEAAPAIARGDGRLTERGCDQARALGIRLRWHDCAPTRMVASPAAGAVQTAELIVAALATAVPVEVDAALARGGDPAEVARALRAQPRDAVVVVVGHEPALSTVGALLLDCRACPALAEAVAVRIIDGRLKWRFAWDDEAPEPARP